jgi:hypothetical protein
VTEVHHSTPYTAEVKNEWSLYSPCTPSWYAQGRLYQYRRTNKMQFLYSVYNELTASTCFDHYLILFRRHCINKIDILCVFYVGWVVLETCRDC